jgi:uncharacterized protein (DUF1015 family)
MVRRQPDASGAGGERPWAGRVVCIHVSNDFRGARVRPFRALVFDPAIAGDMQTLVAPPYDVIGPGYRDALAARSPWNVVGIDLPSIPYDTVAATIADWTARGVLTRHSDPVMIAWTQEFTLPDGSRRTRRTLVGVVGAEPYAARVVRPHERTHAGPKEERLRLMNATKVQLSPVFGLYPDPAGEAWAAAAVTDDPGAVITDDEGTVHRLWTIEDPERLAAIEAALAGRWILIADGHHRYETALAYRDERRAEDGDGAEDRAYDFVLMGLTSLDDDGLVVLPTHRVLTEWPAAAEDHLTVTALDDALEALETALATAPADQVAAGLVLPDRAMLLTAPRSGSTAAERLDLAVLERDLLVPALGGDQAHLAHEGLLSYTKDARDAWDSVRSGRAAAALIVRHIPTAQVAAVAEEGGVMPQKSTYFFPKLLTGVAFQPLAD